MKLRRVVKTSDEWQKCCRWCHYFQNGRCFNKEMSHSFSTDMFGAIYSVAESGRLSAVIEETSHSVHREEFRNLEDLLREWKISEKRIKEFSQVFDNCMNQWLDFQLKDELDAQVSRLYQDLEMGDNECEGVEIYSPEEFCCKEWC